MSTFFGNAIISLISFLISLTNFLITRKFVNGEIDVQEAKARYKGRNRCTKGRNPCKNSNLVLKGEIDVKKENLKRS